MAVVYNDIFTDGSTSLSGGAGFAAAAKVLLANQTQAINTGLDVSTNAIDLIHIAGGAPQIVSSSGGAATIKIDNTYTTDPNFVWAAAGGFGKFDFSTNTCPEAIVSGGTIVLNSGTITTLVVTGGIVTIEAGCTVTTLIVSGGAVTSHSAIATVHQSGGSVNSDVRMGSTSYTLSGGTAAIENTSGSGMTLLNLEKSGIFRPMAGDVVTMNRRGGTIVYDAAVRSLTLGSTAFTNYAGKSPASTGLVAVSNLTDYTAYAIGGGGVVTI